MTMDIKQVIVIRKDLNMRKGKCVAQGCHAAMDALENQENNQVIEEWWAQGSTKICVSVSSEQELVDTYNKACAARLPCSIITDAGRTEFNGIPTKTAVAIGPADAAEIDKITGTLSLL